MSANSPLIIVCQWLSRLAVMNISWLLLTIAGGVLLGLFPATVVVCVLLRRYLNGTAQVSMREVLVLYREEFVRANLTGWAILLPVISLGWYIQKVIMQFDGVLAMSAMAMIPVVLSGIALLIATLLQMSLYQADIRGSIQNGLLLIFREPKVLMMCIFVLAVCITCSYLLPVISLFYLVTPAFLTGIAMLWLEKEELSI